MKSKLTITIDSELIPAARRYAHSKGVSLSAVIEQALREATREAGASFAEKWRGAFKLDPEDYPTDDPRFDYLARKYLR
ncbi:MAG: DUF6364 family protein [Chloroflexi bacterium]|nr:DUF6364 family protein [Chloroflexota bacterium]